MFLAYYYTKHEMGLRMAYWFGFAAVAGAFGGLIAFGVQHAHAAVENWRLLFIIEVWGCTYRFDFDLLTVDTMKGIPSVLLGLSALAFLPDRPESTKILNESEPAAHTRQRSRI